MSYKFIFSFVFIVLVGVIAQNSIFIIQEYQKGMLLRFSEISKADLEPGLHFKIPFIEKEVRLDGRIINIDFPPNRYLTVEKKAVIVDSYVAWKIIDTKAFYKATSGNFFNAQRILGSRIDNGLRNEFGERDIKEVVSGQRDELMLELVQKINKVTQSDLGIEVIDIRVKQINLPPEVSESVYQRMNSERERQARELRSLGREEAIKITANADKRRTIIEAEAIKQSEIYKGEGDAEATKIYASAYKKKPKFYSFIRTLEGYKKSFGEESSSIMIVDNRSDFFKLLVDE